MIRAEYFIEAISRAGFKLFTGVPCSYLAPFIDTVIESPHIQYIPAANEGDAVAIACGAELGGRPSVVMFQNSGLGNAVSPLTSLTSTFRIPVLVITTWRGQPGGPEDEPQHDTMGRITPALLDLMRIPWELFPKDENEIGPALARATAHMQAAGTPYALVMPHGLVEAPVRPGEIAARRASGGRERSARPVAPSHSELPRFRACPNICFGQDATLQAIQASVAPTDAVLATTGFTGRALYALDDRPNQFYMVGSMGCVSSLGLGLATVQPHRRVVVIDGDGAMLMRMGALATTGYQSPANLLHIVLDNGCHESTGGQRTVSSAMDVVQLALACGYSNAFRLSKLEDLTELLQTSRRELTFVQVQTEVRQARKLPRPVVSPADVARRFRMWLVESTGGASSACRRT